MTKATWYRLCLGLLLFGPLFYTLQACTTPQTAHSLSPEGPPFGFLWEARRGSQVLTLLGTMHVGVQLQTIPPTFWQRFKQADTIIVETDLRQMNSDLQQRYLLLPPAQSLEQQLGPEAWKKFTTIIRKSFPDIRDSQLRRLSPAAATSQLMLVVSKIESTEAAEADDISMDQLIFERALAEGKTTKTFETVREQLTYLEQVFTLEQLRDLLENFEQEQQQYKTLETAYQQGRSQVIDAMIEELPPALRKILLEQRNVRWIASLDTLISPQHTLIAVGAAHFGGKQSLLRLLAAKGFHIKILSEQSQTGL